MQIIEGLKNLGLNDKEARIYTHLLQSGQTTAYAIAELTGIKRPTVYVVLEELRIRGLVLKIPHAKKQLFMAKSAEEMFLESEDRLNRAKSIIPQLMALTKSGDKPRTYLFEGVNGHKEALDIGVEEMEGKEILGFYSYAGSNAPQVAEINDEHFKKLKNLGVNVRALVPDHETNTGVETRYSNLKIKKIPFDIYSTDNAIDVTDDYVKIYSNDLQTVVIKNKKIAQMFKQIFEMVWSKN